MPNLPQKPRKNYKSQPVEELWQFGTATGKNNRTGRDLGAKKEEAEKRPKKKAEPVPEAEAEAD